MTAFLEALQLFADAFEGSGGFRLLRVARPPILFYGLYGSRTLDASDKILVDLIIQRGLLADQLDCYLGCGCGPDAVKCQVILDKILYDIDRAIDLYAVGKDDLGQPELRAAAYAFLIDYFLHVFNLPPTTCSLPSALYKDAPAPETGILVELQDLLRPDVDYTDPDWKAMIDTLKNVAQEVHDNLPPGELTDNIETAIDALPGVDLVYDLEELTGLYRLTKQGLVQLAAGGFDTKPLTSLTNFILLDTLLGLLFQELCIQKDMELRWENLVKSMAPDLYD
ncbi:MAG: hypothetical protein ACXWTS_03550 [Methylococcaceae bacterium]